MFGLWLGFPSRLRVRFWIENMLSVRFGICFPLDFVFTREKWNFSLVMVYLHSVGSRISTAVWLGSFLMKEAGGFHAVDPGQAARGGQVVEMFSLM